MKQTIKAYFDLTRLHFFFVWPLLFSAGLFSALQLYNGFSISLIARAALIGFFGFEAGLVLNDIVDAEIDKKDVEFNKLTKYWRPFGTRPIAQGIISRQSASLLFVVFVTATTVLALTLPFPNTIYVLAIMALCYILEYFYQTKKRNETIPIAQLVGRIDFTLFPAAGYLCLGRPDINALLLAAFFYPLAMAHLGVNDIADVANDQARNMKTIPTLYGLKKTAYWVLFFTIAHIVTAIVFVKGLGPVAIGGFMIGFLLLSIGNYLILKGKNAPSGMKALPLFHIAMLTYALSIILAYFI